MRKKSNTGNAAKLLMSNRIYRIAIISSVPPDPNRIAGALILSRWIDHPKIQWTYIEPLKKPKSILWRILDRLRRSRFHRLGKPAQLFYEQNLLMIRYSLESFFRYSLQQVSELQPDIILSVAHGPFYKIAHRVSKRLGIPLILLAQDWWPAFPEAGNGMNREEEREFVRICGSSDGTIAVSDGMLRELGNPPNACVVHDLPSVITPSHAPRVTEPRSRFKAIYAGNLADYGPMIEKAALACEDSETVRLEVFGRAPIWWSEGMEAHLSRLGIYRGFLSPSDLLEMANSYDCILATMSFDPSLRLRMRTCFPSKIIELAQLGKPMIVWGPEDCSAVLWARKNNAALCITDESPDALRGALERLAKSPNLRESLTLAIRQSAQNEFNPSKIRQSFMGVLARVVSSPRTVNPLQHNT